MSMTKIEQMQITNLQKQTQTQSEEIVRLNALVIHQSHIITRYQVNARQIHMVSGMIIDEVV